MTAPLNRQPVGVLGFFGIKNGGRYPQVLSEVLAPTFGMEGLYEVQSLTRGELVPAPIVGGVVVFGSFGPVTTPGPTWHVRQASAYIDSSQVGSFAAVRLGIYHQPTGVFVGVTPVIALAVGAVATAYGALAARDFWLGPDEDLAYECVALGGTPTIELAWRAARYDQ